MRGTFPEPMADDSLSYRLSGFPDAIIDGVKGQSA